jgi:hypothetical protein
MSTVIQPLRSRRIVRVIVWVMGALLLVGCVYPGQQGLQLPSVHRSPVIQSQGTGHLPILYPSLRVVVTKSKVERMGSLPPALMSPLGVKALHLQIQSHLSPFAAAKGERLTNFAPQVPIDAFEQGSTSYPVTVEPFQLKVSHRGIEIPFKGSDGLRGFFAPRRGPSRKALFGLFSTHSVIDSTGLLQQVLPFLLMLVSFEFGSALLPHVFELMKNAALINHRRTVDQVKRLTQPSTPITESRASAPFLRSLLVA